MREAVPSWAKKKLVVTDRLSEMKSILSHFSINTVCESSLCPNLSECFSKNHATFLILGKSCTRKCAFCSVGKDTPGTIDDDEPARISAITSELGLKYVVITSVTRDDLEDGGAGQFSKVTGAIRRVKDIRVEVLVPDFRGRRPSVELIMRARPDVFGHNIETVKRLYPRARRGSDYYRSLNILRMAKDFERATLTKSGIMVGLGEAESEIVDAMRDLKDKARCDILTIGQYLRPGKDNLKVERFISPLEFERYEQIGNELGFKFVASGPFVRSSYNAFEIFKKVTEGSNDRSCASIFS